MRRGFGSRWRNRFGYGRDRRDRKEGPLLLLSDGGHCYFLNARFLFGRER